MEVSFKLGEEVCAKRLLVKFCCLSLIKGVSFKKQIPRIVS